MQAIQTFCGWLLVVMGVAAAAIATVGGAIPFGLMMLVCLSGSGAVMLFLRLGGNEPLQGSEELHRYGRPANATVTAVGEEPRGPDGGRRAKVGLHVHPRNESAFRTTRVLALPGELRPVVGDRVNVKFDPHRRRRNIILLAESFEVQDQVTAKRIAFGAP